MRVRESEGRRLCAESTNEEQKLWPQLRAKRFAGFKFRRRHRIGPYFTDFWCIEPALGNRGSMVANMPNRRTKTPQEPRTWEQGYRVVRFWNEQVNAQMEEVLEAFCAALTDSLIAHLGRSAR
jgi:very-short-patch-repair endonuclease